jgi:hypothetical protein
VGPYTRCVSSATTIAGHGADVESLRRVVIARSGAAPQSGDAAEMLPDFPTDPNLLPISAFRTEIVPVWQRNFYRKDLAPGFLGADHATIMPAIMANSPPAMLKAKATAL